MFKERSVIFYELISCMLLASGWMLIGQDYGAFYLHWATIFGLVAGCIGIIKLIDYYKKELLLYLILLMVIIGSLLFLKSFSLQLGKTLKEIIQWYNTYDGKIENYHKGYGFILFTAFTFGVSLGSYIIHKESRLKTIVAIGSFIFLIGCTLKQYYQPSLSVNLLFCFLIFTLLEVGAKWSDKEIEIRKSKEGVIYLMPIALVIVGISSLFPASNEPMEWKRTKALLHTMKEGVLTLKEEINYLVGRGGGEFTLGFSGEEEESTLGGEIKVQDQTPLYVEMDRKTSGTLYLIGSVKDCFTGTGWKRSKEKLPWQTEEYILDLYEFYYGMVGEDISKLVKQRNARIEYRTIKTKSVFYPLKTSSFERDKKTIEQEEADATIRTHRAQGKGSSYRIYFTEFNLGSEEVQEKLRALQGFSYAEQGRKLDVILLREELKGRVERKLLEAKLPKENLSEVFTKRAAFIRKNYTALPEDLPQTIQVLSKEVTQEATTDYDRLKAIEAYLDHYIYTLKPAFVPKDENLLEYFLFTSKEGYCTYFATAMAVMGRCLGIPMRYVEGYVVDYKEKVASNVYKIRSKNAHAWVEAYIEGIGWIPFEPTPAYREGRYAPWQKQDGSRNNYSSFVGEVSLTEEEMRQEIQKKAQEQIEDKKFFSPIPIKKLMYLGIKLIIFLIVLVLGYYTGIKSYKNQKYKKADEKRKLNLIFREILFYMDRKGAGLRLEETLLNYLKRISRDEKGLVEELGEIIYAYMAMKYGNKEISSEIIQKAEVFKRTLLQQIKKEKGQIKAIYYQFTFVWQQGKQLK
ncbi:hypothetical protein CS063_01085 [Sporanaerobium hydrogeniformans]|uniref:Uncharacterized protein n=1 Tax=Sporanaerobium hydrogeniformans TaxID=3072179 RepID=A0AC61DH26_9FIRM|nr:transglutaminase-like domain-containing protein [Sporanaerobium hydrogeniformans]PHV72103.1 hypothetical protein CS063_01085 [Sporanaerobium hydrogeniformans]